MVEQRPGNETRYCWEQVLRVNPLFRISQVFAESKRAARLLPLYALFAAIEETCSAFSDETVARRKLDWWRTECRQLLTRSSDHPILLALQRSGVTEDWPLTQLEALFNSAERRIDAMAPAEFADLRSYCKDVCQPQLDFEAALTCGGTRDEPQIEGWTASIGLAQVLRESRRRATAGDWRWLPLALLARHGLSRAEVAAAPDAAVVRPLFEEWSGEVARWQPARRALSDEEAADTGSRHIYVFGELQARAVRQLRHVAPSRYGQRLTRVGPAELYQAWRAAHRFNRR